jgi:hypothetical protein
MSGRTEGTTNAIDQLLGHTDGPAETPSQEAITRLRYSKQIVDINFTRLSGLCEDMATDGFVYFDPSTRSDTEGLRVNIYADIHNYLSSIYALVEELHQFLNSCVVQSIDKQTFIRGSDRADPPLPPFVKKLVFAWGLRNQFTHGNYRCLSINTETASGSTYMRVSFHKTRFDPRGQGELDDVGDYLWSITEHEETHPMCYFANLHDLFITFWNDLIAWSNRR